MSQTPLERFSLPVLDRRIEYRRAVLFTTVIVLLLASYVAFLVADHPMIEEDPALFEHAGWYITQGAIPYADIWDVKPPLVYAVTTVLAYVSGGNLLVLHVLSGLTSSVAVIGSVLLLGELTYRLTEDDVASIASGLVLLVPAEVYGLPPYEIFPKYLTTAFGLLALYCILMNHPLIGGVSAAISAGFWQPGVGFVLLGIGIVLHYGSRRDLWRILGGITAVTGLILLPFLVSGAITPLIVETAIVPLSGGDPISILGRLTAIVLALGYGAVLVPLGLTGWARNLVTDTTRVWWGVAGIVLFGFQVLLVDMEGALDMLPWLAFIAIGIGLLIATRSDGWRRIIIWGIMILVLTGPIWYTGAFAPGKPTVEELHQQSQPADNPPTDSLRPTQFPNIQTIFWEKIKPRTCHYRLSEKELDWIRRTDGQVVESQCGEWPFRRAPR